MPLKRASKFKYPPALPKVKSAKVGEICTLQKELLFLSYLGHLLTHMGYQEIWSIFGGPLDNS